MMRIPFGKNGLAQVRAAGSATAYIRLQAGLRRSIRQIGPGALFCALVGGQFWFGRATAAAPAQVPAPAKSAEVTLPVTGLSFSSTPTTGEISRARVFENPLVPLGGEPSEAENAALAAALMGYARRSGPDDFASLTGYLESHPDSKWNAALLTGLGLEYYNTAHYSLALDAWQRAWTYAKDAQNAAENSIINRAVSELAYLYARLGRTTELEALLKSVEGRLFADGTGERINGAKGALWTMEHRPEVAFRCGPVAVQRIKLIVDPDHPDAMTIHQTPSTPKGCSLPQVAELSKKVGLNYQMAFREKGAEFIVPSVVHWKVGHYAAMTRQVGDRYLLEDPTFANSVWPTREALEEETSGYFLVPHGELPKGWRRVRAEEGEQIWGKGMTSNNDADRYTCRDTQTGTCGASRCQGMPVSSVHLMLVNIQVRDTPVGYQPPVGPSVRFTARYNSRVTVPQGFEIVSGVLGVKWTHDWLAYIRDSPQSPLADVKCFAGGGGAYTFTGFNPTNQTFALQQMEQTVLKRTGTNSYELSYPDGSKRVFAQPDGSVGSTRSVHLTQVVDAYGNAVTLTYDSQLRLIAITDAIGQVTTFTYGSFANFSITKVTDPFGRFATFDYTTKGPPTNLIYVLDKITDELGMVSRFEYFGTGDMYQMITPYGVTQFSTTQGGGTTRSAETLFPDGSRERVEYNQSTNVFSSEVGGPLPSGMNATAAYYEYRNTYYWSRTACAMAYGDYRKAKVYHWLHSSDGTTTAGMLESIKEPLENRVYYDYTGQPSSIYVGNLDKPTHVGRVLDDGSTQLHTFGYNSAGNMTNMIDPVGRRLSFIYATNGIDLLEVRQTRAGKNELLYRKTYNQQHHALTLTDPAGQTTTFTYNARGQKLTVTNPKGETTTYNYDPNGYLIAVDGPLPGAVDQLTMTYDGFGRPRTLTDLSGYTVTFDYDAMDRLTRITYPDGTFNQYTYDLLNLASYRDRAGRMTLLEHNNMRQITKVTDPLGRAISYDWCRCGNLRSLTDPLGRKTSWFNDVQGRTIAKQYADGSQVRYVYEKGAKRLRQVIDEKQQIMQFGYNLDNSIRSLAYANSTIPTPGVSYTYDPDYPRVASMTDSTGTTLFNYVLVGDTPTLGAGRLASLDGPFSDDTITYGYDELGRAVYQAIDGVGSALTYDTLGRITGITNALGAFAVGYDGNSTRMVSLSFPNGQSEERAYNGNVLDHMLQRITHRRGSAPISEFLLGRDIARGQISTWSQQAGAQPPLIYTFGYDALDQLLSATVTNAGLLINSFAYGYDKVGNRLSEQIGSTNYGATYNTLNQLSTSTSPSASRTNEWDALDRLVAVNAGNQRTEFAYDSLSRLTSIRLLTNAVQASFRRLVWAGSHICEERDVAGTVTKRFFHNGVKLETGPNSGSYYYTRDHLGSIRELVDSSGNVRARYAYDPYGRRTRITGDLEADFGFGGMFWAAEARLAMTHFRAYDPELGRWLSRDPLPNAERKEGPNLYSYVLNQPVSHIDPQGLCMSSLCACFRTPAALQACIAAGIISEKVLETAPETGEEVVVACEEAGQVIDQLIMESEYIPNLSMQTSQTIPGMGPDTINVTADTRQQLVQELPELEEGVLRGQDLLNHIQEAGGLLDRNGRMTDPWIQEAVDTWIETIGNFVRANRDMPVADRLEAAWRRAVEVIGLDLDLFD